MKFEEIGYASVRGILHDTGNIPNQDACSVKRYKFGTILAVSDGHRLLSEWNPVSAGDDRTLIYYRRR